MCLAVFVSRYLLKNTAQKENYLFLMVVVDARDVSLLFILMVVVDARDVSLLFISNGSGRCA